MAPLIRALEIVTEKSTFDPNFLQPSSTDPDSGSCIQKNDFLFFISKLERSFDFFISGHSSMTPNSSVVSSPRTNRRPTKYRNMLPVLNRSMVDLRSPSMPGYDCAIFLMSGLYLVPLINIEI